MKITCLGAARTVTGSSYLIDLTDGECFLVDCGLYQGGRKIEERNWDVADYHAKDLKAIFITHAHIDHSGLVPRMVRMGFQGPVYATEATAQLLRILWLDSAHIQEMEAQWQTRKNSRQGAKEVEPLYETTDAEAAIGLIAPLELDQTHENVLPGVSATYVTAGHILGAASLHLRLEDAEGVNNVGFSGDIGRPNQLIVPDPERMPKVDTMFMETTYGARMHKTIADSAKELMEVIQQAYAENGRVVIPSFAVERTQEIIFVMAKAWREGQWPGEMPVFLDSPLAIKATEIFRKHPEFFDAQTQAILDAGDRPLNFPFLKFTPSTEESRAINDYNGPMVVIAGNGMGTAGRIKHHLKHNLWRPNCHVLIVGYQAQGTTGRQLVDGADTVKIFREDVSVRAHVHTIGGFSAHADQGELLQWLTPQVHAGLTVNLIHGEEAQSLEFARIAQERFPQAHFHVPKWKETITLKPSEVVVVEAAPAEDFSPPAEQAPMPERRKLVAEVRKVRNRLEDIMLELLAAEGGIDAQRLGTLQQALQQADDALQRWEAA